MVGIIGFWVTLHLLYFSPGDAMAAVTPNFMPDSCAQEKEGGTATFILSSTWPVPAA
jgi:hypothetical protein